MFARRTWRNTDDHTRSATPPPPIPTSTTPLYDADQHYYEPQDCLTRHLEPQYRNVVKWADIGGRTTVIIHGKQLTVVPNPTYDPVGAPGSLEVYFRSENHDAKELRDIVKMQQIQPEYRDRDARIARLDEQGVEQTWMIPSLGLGIEEMLQEDPESAVAIFRAYNRWLEDDWGYDRDGRIVTGPMITLIDAEAAEAELDRVMAVGTRMVIMKAGPVGQPARATAVSRRSQVRPLLGQARRGRHHRRHSRRRRRLHQVPRRLGRERASYTGLKTTPLTEVLSVAIERPIFDMMAAMICHGLFDRHPKLKVATLELGSAWVPELHRRLRVHIRQDTPAVPARPGRVVPRARVDRAVLRRQHHRAARRPRRRPDPARLRLAAPGGPRPRHASGSATSSTSARPTCARRCATTRRPSPAADVAVPDAARLRRTDGSVRRAARRRALDASGAPRWRPRSFWCDSRKRVGVTAVALDDSDRATEPVAEPTCPLLAWCSPRRGRTARTSRDRPDGSFVAATPASPDTTASRQPAVKMFDTLSRGTDRAYRTTRPGRIARATF